MNSIMTSDDASEESEFLSALNVLFTMLSKMNKKNAFIENRMPWERCFGRATDGIRQERYTSINFKRAVQPTPHQKPPQNSLFFVGLQSLTVPSPSSASETYSLRTKEEDVSVYKINHIFVGRTVQHCM